MPASRYVEEEGPRTNPVELIPYSIRGENNRGLSESSADSIVVPVDIPRGRPQGPGRPTHQLIRRVEFCGRRFLARIPRAPFSRKTTTKTRTRRERSALPGQLTPSARGEFVGEIQWMLYDFALPSLNLPRREMSSPPRFWGKE